MTENEKEIVKQCAAIVAQSYDSLEPWVSPNCILTKFKLTPWKLIDDAWHDPETGANYYFPN